MPYLILVRHSLPEIIPTQPANRWVLSIEGRERCIPLADELAPYEPHIFISSLEPKAIETAKLAAKRLGLPARTAPGLHEHDRTNAPFTNMADFRTSVARFFDHPNELVYGNETAARALERFSTAVTTLLSEHPDQNLAVVAHGTVITLFVAHHNPITPYKFWQNLTLPHFTVLSIPGLELEKAVRIER